MRTKEFNKVRTRSGGAVAAIFLFALSETLCSGADPANGYKPPRAADGKPDLQGIWTNSSVTDLERPANIHKLILTPKEAAEWVASDELVEHVVILNEMVEHAHTVRLNAAYVPKNIRPLFGDSIGWWDGDTLIGILAGAREQEK